MSLNTGHSACWSQTLENYLLQSHRFMFSCSFDFPAGLQQLQLFEILCKKLHLFPQLKANFPSCFISAVEKEIVSLWHQIPKLQLVVCATSYFFHRMIKLKKKKSDSFNIFCGIVLVQIFWTHTDSSARSNFTDKNQRGSAGSLHGTQMLTDVQWPAAGLRSNTFTCCLDHLQIC